MLHALTYNFCSNLSCVVKMHCLITSTLKIIAEFFKILLNYWKLMSINEYTLLENQKLCPKLRFSNSVWTQFELFFNSVSQKRKKNPGQVRHVDAMMIIQELFWLFFFSSAVLIQDTKSVTHSVTKDKTWSTEQLHVKDQECTQYYLIDEIPHKLEVKRAETLLFCFKSIELNAV